MLDPINRLSLHGRRRPAVFFAVMLAVTAAFYIPGRIHYGAGSWFEFGPFSVQHGRVMLYATYFFFGAGIGVAFLDRGLLAADGRMAKVSWDWMILTIVPYYLMWVLISIKRDILGNPVDLPDWYEGLYAVCFTVFSVAILFLILAYFLRFASSGRSVLDAMQADAYGIFLVHYPIALWLQYWLFDFNLAGDRESTHRIRADGRVQLGADARVAADSGREAGVVTHSSFRAMRSIEPGISDSRCAIAHLRSGRFGPSRNDVTIAFAFM